MKIMDTVADENKLIAEFLGWEFNEPDFVFPEGSWSVGGGLLTVDLMFGESWDSLMPVVEKIEALSDNIVDKVYVSINGKTCGMWTYFVASDVLRIGAENNTLKINCTGKTKIEAVWQAVIQFIKWYNKENKVHRSVATNDPQWLKASNQK
jgi:hypothetical protein